MSCPQPTTPVPLTLCMNSAAKANVTDDMIGISSVAGTFSVTGIDALSGGTTGTCAAVPTGYIPIVNTIISTFGDYIKPGSGATPYGANRTATGLLTPTAVGTILGKLKICINTTNFNFKKENVAACDISDNLFITGVQIECGYYYALYKYAIRNLAAAIVCPATPVTRFGTGTTSWADSGIALARYTDAAIILNQMVNDVIYIMDQVAKTRTDVDIAALTTTLNTLDTTLEQVSLRLTNQRDALGSPGQDKMVLFKEMEAYSRQKAAYHNNMLALYSFLNITALGLLFYVYRST